MKKLGLITFGLFYFFYNSFVQAQELQNYPSWKTLSTTKRIQQNLLSPFQQSEVHPVLWTGLSTVTLLLLKREDVGDPLQDNWSKRKPLGKWADFGDLMGQMVPNALYMGGMYAHYKYTNNKKSLYRSGYMLETSLYSGLFTTVFKVLIAEERPNKGDRKSFPSGHTTTAFAFASAVGFEHSLYASIPAYMLATLVGLSRINDNAHYLHDVVAGATVGIAFGAGIHHLHKKQNIKTAKRNDFQWIGLSYRPHDDGGELLSTFVF